MPIETLQGPRRLYKTTIVIWSEDNPNEMELSTLAQEAESGNAYCSRMRSTLVEEPTKDADWDDTEFFDLGG